MPDLLLAEQCMIGFEDKEAFELGDNDGSHFRIRGEDKRMGKSCGLDFDRECGAHRQLCGWPAAAGVSVPGESLVLWATIGI